MRFWKKAVTVALLFAAAVGAFPFSRPEAYADEDLLCGAEYISPANNKQFHASVWLGTCEGELYYSMPWVKSSIWQKERDPREGWLCRFENGQTTLVIPLVQSDTDHIDILGMSGKYVYYYSSYYGNDSDLDHDVQLLCCDLETGEVTGLYSALFRGNRSVQYLDEASVRIPVRSKEDSFQTLYLNVQGNEVLSVSDDPAGPKPFAAGGREYYIEDKNDIPEHVMVRTADGESAELPLGRGFERSLIKTEKGLLIHNYGQRDLLYYVDEEGTVTELFSVPCSLSDSAVTVYHNVVYLSLMRYEKGASSGLGMEGYKNDAVKGTYRIDLEDGSAEKISDRIFNGMYIFDDTGIFACDDDNRVYKLDFDGNVIKRLL